MHDQDDQLTIEKLNELYKNAKSCDKELFSEMRTNVLMVSGKHFKTTQKQIYRRMKDSHVDEKTKIRLVKNHIQKITRVYVNELLSQAPGVRVLPHAESELQDQKAAELNNSVWQDAKHRHKLAQKIQDWGEDFVDLGECAVKIFWDKNKGDLVGFEQEVDKEGNSLFTDTLGEPTIESQTFDPMTGMSIPHKPLKSDRAVYSGDFVLETLLPFNLFRAPSVESMDESPYFFVDKMMKISDAKKLANGDQDKLKFIQVSAESTFKIFDCHKGDFVDSKDQVLIREGYFRPCHEYPYGWVSYFTETGILFEDKLPFGVFPIKWAGFQKIQTTPRAHSIIRSLRPLQSNLNQLSSQQVTHQLSVGDDKLLINSATKMEKGGEFPGVRALKYSGNVAPIILPGRAGEQFVAAIAAVVQEMYDIANLADIKEEMSGQMDANVLLFRSMRHKKKFSLYASTFERFLMEVCELYLELAKNYLPDDRLVQIVGKREVVNIPEFKSTEKLQFQVKLEAVGDDIETMLGKSLQIGQVIQYLGKDLPPESLAQIVSNMPFMNADQMFSDLLLDKKNADSDILAMDRGEYIPAQEGENHVYIAKRLLGRMKMRDFTILSPKIQAAYKQKKTEHDQMEAEQAAQLKRMQSEFIPTGGALIGVDVYTEQPNSSGGQKTVRARLPYEAVMDLIKKLDVQKNYQMQFEDAPQAVASGIANQFNQASSSVSGVSPGMPQNLSMDGQGAQYGSQRNDFSQQHPGNSNIASGF